jgi:uncharacterized protein
MPTFDQARSWYPAADPVHGFDHVLRVYRVAESLAQAEGADLDIVCAAALLHDANPDPEGIERPAHHLQSAEFGGQVLRAEGWDEGRIAAVQHCIRSHRFRDHSEPPQTIEAQVLFDADKLDAIGALGVARAIAYAACAGQPAYAPPSPHFLSTGQTEVGEPHSAYHEYLFKLARIQERLYTAAGRALAGERHAYMVQFFERLAQEAASQA